MSVAEEYANYLRNLTKPAGDVKYNPKTGQFDKSYNPSIGEKLDIMASNQEVTGVPSQMMDNRFGSLTPQEIIAQLDLTTFADAVDDRPIPRQPVGSIFNQGVDPHIKSGKAPPLPTGSATGKTPMGFIAPPAGTNVAPSPATQTQPVGATSSTPTFDWQAYNAMMNPEPWSPVATQSTPSRLSQQEQLAVTLAKAEELLAANAAENAARQARLDNPTFRENAGDANLRALLAAQAAGGDMAGPTVAGDTAGIEAAAQAEAAAAVAAGNALSPFGEGLDSRGRAIGDYDFGDGQKGLGGGDPDAILFLESWNADVLEGLDLAGLDPVEAARIYENKSADMAKDQGFISDDVHTALLNQIVTDEGGNINAPIFQWGVNTETGADQIVMAPVEEQIVVPTGEVEVEVEVEDDDPPIFVPPEDELTYEQKQKQISTNSYNGRVAAIQAAVKAGNIDIDDAQEAFNIAKNQLFADMAALNKITYDEVTDTFSFNTQQRAADVQSMLDLLATQGVEQNLIQDVIGGDIGMNLAGYAEETDAMRDFSEMLNIIGQQGSGEAGMLGNYMFDSYRQDLDTTGRNMELQAAMQMLAEQQAASEQNLQSSMLGPYFGIDPALMMAGMGAGVDVAGVSENRAVREQAAEDAMELLLAQQKFATDERVAGETFTGGQNYQNNLWDYVTSQTMNPYQSGMLDVAQQGQQVDTMSALMDMMTPAQPSAAQIAASNEQAATLATQSALESAMAKIAMGDIPAQEPIFKQGQMMQGMAGYQMNAASFTGEELMALDSVGVDIEDLTVNRSDTVQSLDNMQTFANAINMPLAELMGAQDMGVLGSYFSEIVAAGNDPYVDYMRPSGAIENIQLSQAMKLQEYEYPDIGEDTPYQLGWNPDMPGGNVGSLEQGLNISSLIDLNEALVAAGYDEILGDILGLTTP